MSDALPTRAKGLLARTPRGAAALVLIPALALACAPPTAQNSEEDQTWRVDVVITNSGTGSGSVDVRFASGTVQLPCPQRLDPGERCTPFAERMGAPITSVRVTASPTAGSTLAGWDCPDAAANECLFEVELSESGEAPLESVFNLDVQFDLTP